MEVDGYKINSMYVTRETDGSINLFGAYKAIDTNIVVVVKSTKNVEGIGQKLYGEKYTNEYIAEQMKARSAHSFIGFITRPMSFTCAPECVIFV